MIANFKDENGEHAYAQEGEKFENFLKILEEATQGTQNDPTPLFIPQTWATIAKALGVSQTVIHRWRKSREAQLLTSKGISYGLKKMLTAGDKDWRMWESYLKMMGVSPIDKIEHSGNPENPVRKRVIMEIVDQRKEDKNNESDKRILLDEGSDKTEIQDN